MPDNRINENQIKESQVFISYNSADLHFATKLYLDLEREGRNVWFAPRRILCGDYIHEEALKAIMKSSHFIVILTPNSLESGWVKREIQAAFMKKCDQNNCTILPILRRDCEIPADFKGINHEDFRRDDCYHDHLERLLTKVPATVKRITIDSNMLTKAFKDFENTYLELTEGFLTSQLQLCLDTEGSIEQEYDRLLKGLADFEVWLKRLDKKKRLCKGYPSELPESLKSKLSSCCEANILTLIAVAHHADKTLFSESHCLGKSVKGDGTYDTHALSCLQSEFGINVYDGNESLRFIRSHIRSSILTSLPLSQS